MRVIFSLIVLTGSLFFWLKLSEEIALRRWGTETRAQVYNVSKTASSTNRSGYTASYEFTTEDKTVAHGSFVGGRKAQGRSVNILYLRARPEINEPAQLAYGVLCMGFFGSLGWLLTWWASRILLRRPGPDEDKDEEERSRYWCW